MKNVVERIIRYFAYCIALGSVVLLAIALFGPGLAGDANVGDFGTDAYNQGWSVSLNGADLGVLDLPSEVPCKVGETVVLTNTLPDNVNTGMNLTIRTAHQDANIYIDGVLRESYATENFKKMYYYLPSSYVVTALSSEDAGKVIEVKLTLKGKKTSILNEINIGYGNNAWFSVVVDNVSIAIVSQFLIVCGFIVIFIFAAIKDRLKINKSLFYLGILISMAGIWMLSESKIRQLIFSRPSLSSVFSYTALEVIGVLSVLYFDEVQHKRYNKIYFIVEIIAALDLAVNIILDATGVLPFNKTLGVSHAVLTLCVVILITSLTIDFYNKQTVEYSIIAVGMILFLACSFFEILNYYLNPQNAFGVSLSVGLIILMITTIIQILIDAIKARRNEAKRRQEALINTIETIASTLDAKDEYTGGHSNRVSLYAGILAKEVASDYNFSDRDIMRIKYIGLLHDIGKIGVADTVLNKSGRLTDEEFSLMKTHVEIGAALLSSMGDNVEGLIDGIQHHHERYDGKGYPSSLAGENIPLVARILCIADCYDAMTSNRVYRRRLSDEEVRNEILKCAGSQFDPNLAKAFVSLLDRGVVKPATERGLDVDENGNIRKSSLLEEILRRDTEEGKVVISNPEHVRMVCYICKLSEYRNLDFEVFTVRCKDHNEDHDNRDSEHTNHCEEINIIVKEFIRKRDINIQYSEDQNIVVLFNRTKREIFDFREAVSAKAVVQPISINDV